MHSSGGGGGGREWMEWIHWLMTYLSFKPSFQRVQVVLYALQIGNFVLQLRDVV